MAELFRIRILCLVDPTKRTDGSDGKPKLPFGIQPFMSEPKASRSDPTPEERTGDSSIRLVIVAFVATIIIVLIAAMIFVRARRTKAIPAPHDAHAMSQTISPSVGSPLRSWVSLGLWSTEASQLI
jgi:hypothetical protein